MAFNWAVGGDPHEPPETAAAFLTAILCAMMIDVIHMASEVFVIAAVDHCGIRDIYVLLLTHQLDSAPPSGNFIGALLRSVGIDSVFIYRHKLLTNEVVNNVVAIFCWIWRVSVLRHNVLQVPWIWPMDDSLEKQLIVFARFNIVEFARHLAHIESAILFVLDQAISIQPLLWIRHRAPW